MKIRKAVSFLAALLSLSASQADLIRIGDFVPTLENPTGNLPVNLPNPGPEETVEVPVIGQVIYIREARFEMAGMSIPIPGTVGEEHVFPGVRVEVKINGTNDVFSAVSGADGGFRIMARIPKYRTVDMTLTAYGPGNMTALDPNNVNVVVPLNRVDYFNQDSYGVLANRITFLMRTVVLNTTTLTMDQQVIQGSIPKSFLDDLNQAYTILGSQYKR